MGGAGSLRRQTVARTPAHPHLPAGHDPGPQTRRSRFGRVAVGCLLPLLAFFAVSFLVVFGGIGLLVLSSGGGAIGAPFVAVGVLVFAICTSLAVVTWRRARPRRLADVTATPERLELRRGDELRVRVDAPVGTADLEVGLVCQVRYDVQVRTSSTDGGSSSSRRTRVAPAREAWTPASSAGASLVVPADAPCSYEGDAVSFAWAVAARVRGGRRTSVPVAVWVAP